MKIYRHTSRIKLGLFLLGMSIVALVFGVNKYIVNEIRGDARSQVKHLAKAYSNAINSEDTKDIQYVMDVLLPSLNFPIIITTSDEIYATKNLNLSITDDSPDYTGHVRQITSRMDVYFEPLPVKWNDILIGEIHYSDPAVISMLRWLPYFEIGFAIIFLVLSFTGFQLIRKSEKNYIWAGMARETAHQLGTPISSLLGWQKLLEDGNMDQGEILRSMSEDTRRLSEISDRFFKIGSVPKFVTIDTYQFAQDVLIYMKSRLPKNSKINLSLTGAHPQISGAQTLLTWALENLIKNAIDACDKGQNRISINIKEDEKMVHLNVTDTGKGIDRRDRKNIFRPGYSTKERGWGLGLSLTRRIIEDIHKGKIKLISSRPGETVIRISLLK